MSVNACYRQSRIRSTLILRADMSIPRRGAKSTLRLFFSILVLLLLCGFVACSAYLRLGTTLISEFPSPDGNWDAVLMVRNGGAMTGYATVVSVNRDYWLARQFALVWPTAVFVVDDNAGKISWGDRGQINVKVRWVTGTQLVVSYPKQAGVLRQEPRAHSVNVQYLVSE
jgi:hypothetical protein